MTTIDMGRKARRAAVRVPFAGELGFRLTQCGLGRSLLLYTKWCLHPLSRLATIDLDRKLSVVVKRLDGLRCHLVCMEVGLGPDDFVFDGDPAPQRKGHSPTQFLAHVYCGQTAGWIKMPLATWYGRKPWPRRRCVRWGRSSLP